VTGASSRAKGVRFEQDVARYLETVTTRSVRPGIHDDAGDLVLPGWVLECKDHGRLELGPWLDKAARARADGDRAGLIVKRRQRATSESFVVLTLATFRGLLNG